MRMMNTNTGERGQTVRAMECGDLSPLSAGDLSPSTCWAHSAFVEPLLRGSAWRASPPSAKSGDKSPHSKGRVVLTVLALLLAALPLFAADKKPSKPDTEAEYAAKLEQRAADILSALDLKDAEKAQRVRGIVIAQYRALRDWHDGLDAKLKGAADEEAKVIRASMKALHDKFLASLSTELVPTQIERVKDRMTYDKLRVTFDGYVEMLPKLTAPQKARILELLKEAREEAMDGGSSEEKTAIFGRYKGRINNYLSAEGYDLKQAGKDWAERRKIKSGEQGKEPKKQ